MKHQVCGRLAILEGDVQPLKHEELYTYGLKLPLFQWHIVDVSKLVMSARSCGNVRIQRTMLLTTNCGDIRLQYIMTRSAHGVTSTLFRASRCGEQNDTSETHTSHFWVI